MLFPYQFRVLVCVNARPALCIYRKPFDLLPIRETTAGWGSRSLQLSQIVCLS